MDVISNENTNFVFKFSEFEFSELKCFGLITVLLARAHKKFTSTLRPSTQKNEKLVNLTKDA